MINIKLSKIHDYKCGDLFTNDLDICKTEYRSYAKRYHPDSDCGNSEIFDAITKLYNKAIDLIASGDWEKSNYIQFTNEKNKTLELSYLMKDRFDLGEMYIGNSFLMYIFSTGKDKYADNFIKRVNEIKYSDSSMESEFKRYIPSIRFEGKLNTGERYIVISKTPDIVPLKLLLNNKLEHKHSAWIISRLFNIGCFLRYNGIVHNGIKIDNLFISPKYHTVMLYGGWWFSTLNKEEMIGCTKDIYDIMSANSKMDKMSNYVTDIESIRLVGRKICSDYPKEVNDFLNMGSTGDAYKEIKSWNSVLVITYGEKRKFTPFEININQLYENQEGKK